MRDDARGGDVFAEYDANRPNDQPGTLAIWIDEDAWVEAELPPRPWVAPGYALRGAVTIVAGPPSALKSSLMLAWGCAVALGQRHGRFIPNAAEAAVIYNVEDDATEQRRRLSAALRQFDATPDAIAGKLVRVGPSGIGTLFARDPDTGDVLPTPAMTRLRALIAKRLPAILVADPFAELHDAEENDNTMVRRIVAEFRALAVEFNVAVILVHHTRKGIVTPGDPDAARGASSIIGAGRIVLTLTSMSEQDAEGFGLSTDRRSCSRYVRLDDAKQNYSSISEAVWYEKIPYDLDNGESVPAAVPWKAPDMWEGVSTSIANAILDELDAGLDGGKRFYTDHPKATDRAAADVVLRYLTELNRAQARGIIKAWLKTGVLRRKNYYDEVERKERVGLRVNPLKRPGPRAS
jgi:hypothetical protein